MATTLQHKRSNTTGDIPSTTSLALGELAINTTDGYLFLKKSVGGTESIVRISGAAISSEASVFLDTFSGDGVTNVFTLSIPPQDDQYVFVTINGVKQHVDAYSLTDDQITFSTAPANGDAIECRTLSVRTAEVIVRDNKKFFYTISSTTGSLSGLDDNNSTLTYDVGQVDVYQNGVRLIEDSDYTASTGSSVTFTTSLESGDIVEIVSYSKASLLDQDALKSGGANLPTTASDQLVDSFNKGAYRSAKYIIQATYGTAYHVTEVLLLHDNTNVYLTEYGTMFTGSSLITVNGDITGTNVRLLCTPANSNTEVKVQRITVTV